MKRINYLIRFGRRKKKISQKELGRITGISHQIISRYEKGVEIPTDEKLQLIFSVLDLNADEIENTSNQIDELFEKFIDELFYRKANYDEYLRIFNKSKDLYRQSYNFYKIAIIEFICHVLKGIPVENLDTKFRRIENLNIQDFKALQIYYEYKGFYLLRKKDSSEGLACLEKAKSLRFDEKTIAMIHYHMSFAYNFKWLRETNCEMLLDAKRTFQKYQSFRRVSDCEMILGNYYSTYRNFSYAMECYNNQLRLLEIIHGDNEEYMILHQTMAYKYIQQKKYIEALKEIEKVHEYKNTNYRIYLYNIWCYYKLGDLNKANYWIVKMKRLELNRELKMILNLFDMLVLQHNKIPSDKLIERAVKVYEYYKEEDDLDLTLFYIDIVIDLFERKNDYKNAFYYQKDKIFMLENM